MAQDEQFLVLLHKKIMNKTGSAKRRAKKYYMDQYRKTGVIPKPLLLAGEGIMEGRKCSGRKQVLCEAVKSRFVEMVKASTELSDPGFVFITQQARTIKNYHHWLEQEFDKAISLSALRRYASKSDLWIYLSRPDFEEADSHYAFKDEPVFDLVQMDGCVLHYLKIRDPEGRWKKPQVIEFYDTGSRYMFVLDPCFSESSENAVAVFMQFLLSTAFPQKQVRLRPDNAGGFLNLKRAIHELNICYSVPDGFYLKADFARKLSPKDKVQLESSHRSLHNFEARIIKAFENRIDKIIPGYLFKGRKKQKIMVTHLDITLEDLAKSGLIEAYRKEHNETKHFFSVNGKTTSWIPAQKFDAYMAGMNKICFSPEMVSELMRYGFKKIPATVSVKGTLTVNKQTYMVVDGADKFSRHKSTKVKISIVDDKLYIFEHKDDGVFLGEAICREPFEKTKKTPVAELKANELEQIIQFLSEKDMVVDRGALMERYKEGLTLSLARSVYEHNQPRYEGYLLKLRQPPQITGTALFNAFILDCIKHQRKPVYGDK